MPSKAAGGSKLAEQRGAVCVRENAEFGLFRLVAKPIKLEMPQMAGRVFEKH